MDDIRERHVPAAVGVCDHCYRHWPCDTAQVLAALDAYMEQASRLMSKNGDLGCRVGGLVEQVDAARALADELAAALIEHKLAGCSWFDAYDAETLAKWEASKA